MKCKKCGHRLRVIKTEEIGSGVYRVRRCEWCKDICSTSEANPQEEPTDESRRDTTTRKDTQADR